MLLLDRANERVLNPPKHSLGNSLKQRTNVVQSKRSMYFIPKRQRNTRKAGSILFCTYEKENPNLNLLANIFNYRLRTTLCKKKKSIRQQNTLIFLFATQLKPCTQPPQNSILLCKKNANNICWRALRVKRKKNSYLFKTEEKYTLNRGHQHTRPSQIERTCT